jgi:NAD(P)H-hydrate repair Nnr-like enzyme with NAD(P)H-hydrate dehydratase domain
MVDPLAEPSIDRLMVVAIVSCAALDPFGLLKTVLVLGEYGGAGMAATLACSSAGAGSAWLVGPSATSMVADVTTATAARPKDRTRRSGRRLRAVTDIVVSGLSAPVRFASGDKADG